MIDDVGETTLCAGDCVAFSKGDGNGQHLQNRSDEDCVFVSVGGRAPHGVVYPDIAMIFTAWGRYQHLDGRDCAAARA